MQGLEGVLAITLIFGIPIVAILTAHSRRMLELKLRLREADVRASSDDIAKLRQEITELRDTTTRYDLSFDTILQRLESRVAHLEGQVRAGVGGTAVNTDEARSQGGG
jgi:hypothetical protein